MPLLVSAFVDLVHKQLYAIYKGIREEINLANKTDQQLYINGPEDRDLVGSLLKLLVVEKVGKEFENPDLFSTISTKWCASADFGESVHAELFGILNSSLKKQPLKLLQERFIRLYIAKNEVIDKTAALNFPAINKFIGQIWYTWNKITGNYRNDGRIEGSEWNLAQTKTTNTTFLHKSKNNHITDTSETTIIRSLKQIPDDNTKTSKIKLVTQTKIRPKLPTKENSAPPNAYPSCTSTKGTKKAPTVTKPSQSSSSNQLSKVQEVALSYVLNSIPLYSTQVPKVPINRLPPKTTADTSCVDGKYTFTNNIKLLPKVLVATHPNSINNCRSSTAESLLIPISSVRSTDHRIKTTDNLTSNVLIPTSLDDRTQKRLQTSDNLKSSDSVPTSSENRTEDRVQSSDNLSSSDLIPTSSDIRTENINQTSDNLRTSVSLPDSTDKSTEDRILLSDNLRTSVSLPASTDYSTEDRILPSDNLRTSVSTPVSSDKSAEDRIQHSPASAVPLSSVVDVASTFAVTAADVVSISVTTVTVSSAGRVSPSSTPTTAMQQTLSLSSVASLFNPSMVQRSRHASLPALASVPSSMRHRRMTVEANTNMESTDLARSSCLFAPQYPVSTACSSQFGHRSSTTSSAGQSSVHPAFPFAMNPLLSSTSTTNAISHQPHSSLFQPRLDVPSDYGSLVAQARNQEMMNNAARSGLMPGADMNSYMGSWPDLWSNPMQGMMNAVPEASMQQNNWQHNTLVQQTVMQTTTLQRNSLMEMTMQHQYNMEGRDMQQHNMADQISRKRFHNDPMSSTGPQNKRAAPVNPMFHGNNNFPGEQTVPGINQGSQANNQHSVSNILSHHGNTQPDPAAQARLALVNHLTANLQDIIRVLRMGIKPNQLEKREFSGANQRTLCFTCTEVVLPHISHWNHETTIFHVRCEPYECETCRKKFHVTERFIDHLRNGHNDSTPTVAVPPLLSPNHLGIAHGPAANSMGFGQGLNTTPPRMGIPISSPPAACSYNRQNISAMRMSTQVPMHSQASSCPTSPRHGQIGSNSQGAHLSIGQMMNTFNQPYPRPNGTDYMHLQMSQEGILGNSHINQLEHLNLSLRNNMPHNVMNRTDNQVRPMNTLALQHAGSNPRPRGPPMHNAMLQRPPFNENNMHRSRMPLNNTQLMQRNQKAQSDATQQNRPRIPLGNPPQRTVGNPTNRSVPNPVQRNVGIPQQRMSANPVPQKNPHTRQIKAENHPQKKVMNQQPQNSGYPQHQKSVNSTPINSTNPPQRMQGNNSHGTSKSTLQATSKTHGASTTPAKQTKTVPVTQASGRLDKNMDDINKFIGDSLRQLEEMKKRNEAKKKNIPTTTKSGSSSTSSNISSGAKSQPNILQKSNPSLFSHPQSHRLPPPSSQVARSATSTAVSPAPGQLSMRLPTPPGPDIVDFSKVLNIEPIDESDGSRTGPNIISIQPHERPPQPNLHSPRAVANIKREAASKRLRFETYMDLTDPEAARQNQVTEQSQHQMENSALPSGIDPMTVASRQAQDRSAGSSFSGQPNPGQHLNNPSVGQSGQTSFRSGPVTHAQLHSQNIQSIPNSSASIHGQTASSESDLFQLNRSRNVSNGSQQNQNLQSKTGRSQVLKNTSCSSALLQSQSVSITPFQQIPRGQIASGSAPKHRNPNAPVPSEPIQSFLKPNGHMARASLPNEVQPVQSSSLYNPSRLLQSDTILNRPVPSTQVIPSAPKSQQVNYKKPTKVTPSASTSQLVNYNESSQVIPPVSTQCGSVSQRHESLPIMKRSELKKELVVSQSSHIIPLMMDLTDVVDPSPVQPNPRTVGPPASVHATVGPSQVATNPVGPSQVATNPVGPSPLATVNPVVPSQLATVNSAGPSLLATVNPVRPSQLATVNPVEPNQVATINAGVSDTGNGPLDLSFMPPPTPAPLDLSASHSRTSSINENSASGLAEFSPDNFDHGLDLAVASTLESLAVSVESESILSWMNPSLTVPSPKGKSQITSQTREDYSHNISTPPLPLASPPRSCAAELIEEAALSDVRASTPVQKAASIASEDTELYFEQSPKAASEQLSTLPSRDDEDILAMYLSYDNKSRRESAEQNSTHQDDSNEIESETGRAAASFNVVDFYSEPSSPSSTASFPSTIPYGLSSCESTPGSEPSESPYTTPVREQGPSSPILNKASSPEIIQQPYQPVLDNISDDEGDERNGHMTPDSGHVTSDSVSESGQTDRSNVQTPDFCPSSSNPLNQATTPKKVRPNCKCSKKEVYIVLSDDEHS